MKGLTDITSSLRCLKETSDDYMRFTLKRVTLDDVGTYCILAKNRYGCDRAFFTVRLRHRARSETPPRNVPETVPTYKERYHQTGKKNNRLWILNDFFYSWKLFKFIL